jgi:hypothetical protein
MTSTSAPRLGSPLPTSAPGLGHPRPTSAPGLGSPLPTSAPGLSPPLPTSVPGLGSSLPHVHRDWVRPARLHPQRVAVVLTHQVSRGVRCRRPRAIGAVRRRRRRRRRRRAIRPQMVRGAARACVGCADGGGDERVGGEGGARVTALEVGLERRAGAGRDGAGTGDLLILRDPVGRRQSLRWA